MFVNVHQVGLATMSKSYIHITRPDAKKTVPNCDVSFANGELHQALWSRDVDDER